MHENCNSSFVPELGTGLYDLYTQLFLGYEKQFFFGDKETGRGVVVRLWLVSTTHLQDLALGMYVSYVCFGHYFVYSSLWEFCYFQIYYIVQVLCLCMIYGLSYLRVVCTAQPSVFDSLRVHLCTTCVQVAIGSYKCIFICWDASFIGEPETLHKLV